MKIAAINDWIVELRQNASVLESYAQLAQNCEDVAPTTIQQVGSFMFLVYQQQCRIIDRIETAISK